MKFDDAINGLIAIVFGAVVIAFSRGMDRVAHIEYGPALFPTIAGVVLIGAGAALIVRRVALGGGAVRGLVELKGAGAQGVAGVLLVLGSILAYVLTVEALGFLVVAPVLLFVLIAWFDRRLWVAAIGAVLGTLVFHTFFYQIMSAPLPWGVLEPWAGVLTW